jgi:MFS family permease
MSDHDIESHRSARDLALVLFVQMLPATLLTPAIRPLFAMLHGSQEPAMHAFMAVNMLGGLLAAPWLGGLADRLARPRRLVAVLAGVDALLLWSVTLALPTPLVLFLRCIEGAAHVGAATILLAEAAALKRVIGDGRAMGLAGAAIMMAIAMGSSTGALALGLDVRAPFWLASLLSLGVAGGSWAHRRAAVPPPLEPRGSVRVHVHKALLVPVTAAFVERFTIGCIVVTFSLFAHRVHGVSDAGVGYLFTLLTLPFALLMYPVGRLSERVPRAVLLGTGAVLYALALGSLGRVPTAGLPWVMLLAGCSSALLFAPTLCYAATLTGPENRGRAMALVNAAGCLGMLLGPAAAGIVSAGARVPGDPASGYRAVFLLAGGSVVVWLVGSLPWLVQRLREEVAAPAPVLASATPQT